LPNHKTRAIIRHSLWLLEKEIVVMSRTPIPDHLIHKPMEVEENAILFDAFASLIEVTPSVVKLTTEELRGTIAANLLQVIRQKVSEEGELKLPFGLIIKHCSKPASQP